MAVTSGVTLLHANSKEVQSAVVACACWFLIFIYKPLSTVQGWGARTSDLDFTFHVHNKPMGVMCFGSEHVPCGLHLNATKNKKATGIANSSTKCKCNNNNNKDKEHEHEHGKKLVLVSGVFVMLYAGVFVSVGVGVELFLLKATAAW